MRFVNINDRVDVNPEDVSAVIVDSEENVYVRTTNGETFRFLKPNSESGQDARLRLIAKLENVRIST